MGKGVAGDQGNFKEDFNGKKKGPGILFRSTPVAGRGGHNIVQLGVQGNAFIRDREGGGGGSVMLFKGTLSFLPQSSHAVTCSVLL